MKQRRVKEKVKNIGKKSGHNTRSYIGYEGSNMERSNGERKEHKRYCSVKVEARNREGKRGRLEIYN